MLKTVLIGTLALVAGSAVVVRADAKEDVTNAANKLAEANSYSWSTESEGGGPSVDGKTEKDGYTSITMNFNGNAREMIRKGEKVVIKTDDGWQTPEEMAAARGNDQNNQGQGQRRRGRGRGMGNFTLPAEEIKHMAESTKGLQQSGDVISGDLTEDATKQMMTRGGRGRRGGNADQGNGPEVSNAKGSVKFWLENGNINKVEYHVSGTISFNGNDRDIDRTTTITVKDVGNTKVEVPDEAKKKLGE